MAYNGIVVKNLLGGDDKWRNMWKLWKKTEETQRHELWWKRNEKANGIKEIQCNETNKNLMKYIKKHEKI
jgi:hypothetical protein